MPKKSKKIKPESNKYKKLEWQKEIPVVNGVQNSLGWLPPFMGKDTISMYMPKDGYVSKTGELFHDLLKNRFGLNLEADPEDAAMRIFSPNKSGDDFKEKYLQEMEEIDLMPDCKEKFRKKEEIAKDFEKGLFYLMAKGSLAVVPLGETEPRQIRCDVNNEVFTVTEPLVLCDTEKIQSMYRAYPQQKVLKAPREPVKPVFNEKAPEEPKKPEPFKMEAPGKRPEPPRFKKRPEPPQKPGNILDGTSRDEMIQALFEQKMAEAGLEYPGNRWPEQPVFNMRTPEREFYEGEVEEPDPGQKAPEPPVKPEGYDAFVAEAENRERMAEAIYPGPFDYEHYVPIARQNPGPFTEEAPEKPYLDIPEPPELKLRPLPDRPKPKWRFEAPAPLELHVPDMDYPHLTVQEPKIPVIGQLPETLIKPELRPEPANPGGFKRFFSSLNSTWKRQAEDHDRWVQEQRDYPSKLEQYEAKRSAELIHLNEKYKQEMDQYALDKAAYDAAKAEYEQNLREFKQTQENLEPENEMLLKEYEIQAKEYERAKNELGDRFAEEKAKYEKEVADWEAKNRETLEYNQKAQNEYDAASETFQRLDKQCLETYGDAYGDPEKMKQRRQELLDEYEEKRKDYENRKAVHEENEEAYYASVKKAGELAQQKGTSPEENLRYNTERKIRQDLYEQKQIEAAEFRNSNETYNKYENDLENYEIERDRYNNREEHWKEYQEDKTRYDREMTAYKKAKEEYEKKLETYKNWGNIRDKYEADVERLKRSAEINVDHQIAQNKAELDNYEKAYKQWEYDCKIYDRDKERYEEGVQQMSEPGGLITRWEENVKAYEDGKKEHELKMQKYQKEVKEYPGKLQAYNTKLEEHIAKLNQYNEEKKAYDIECERIDRIRNANQKAEDAHYNMLNEDPVRQDYYYNAGSYHSGYMAWKNHVDASKNYVQIQYKDPDKYKKGQEQYYKNYEKRKSAAPKEMDAEDKKLYGERVQEHNYLKKYPKGMHSYLRELNAQERDYNNSINSKYKKEADLNGISLDDYRKIALNKMYYYKVRDEAQHFSENGYVSSMNTRKIDNLLNANHKNTAIGSMLQNGKLMDSLEKEYDIAKETGTIASSLTDKAGLKAMYDRAYTPKKQGAVMTDPILGKSHEAMPAGPVRK